MKNIFLFGVFIFALLAAQFASAQSVDDIINKYIDARGGKDKLEALKSVYWEGSRQMMGNEIPVRITRVQGKLSRTEFDMAGTTGFMLLTDKSGWTYIPMRSPSPVQMADSNVAAQQIELDIVGPLVDYAAKGNKVTLLGKDTLNGNENYKIQLTTALGKNIIFWIDSKTYFITQTSQKGGGGMGGGRRGGNPDAEMIAVYSDYSAVDGIQFAHTMETKMADGSSMGGVTFDKITINQPVDPKLYLPQ
jgi:hypothetical protein